jgi:hypothetical protein
VRGEADSEGRRRRLQCLSQWLTSCTIIVKWSGAGGERGGGRIEAGIESKKGRDQQLRRRCCFQVLVDTAARMWQRDHALSRDGTGCSSNRADNAREGKVIARAANAADGARHILYNPDRVKIQESAEYDGG